MRKLKYFFFWIIPFVQLCFCAYNLINAIWINSTVTDAMERLDGYAYMMTAIPQAVFLILFSAIALALTVYTYRKEHYVESGDQEC